MTIYDDRMKKQIKENQDIYYAWIEDCQRLGVEGTSLREYKSAVTEFFEKCLNDSVLDLKIETIEDFIQSQKHKLSRKTSKLDFLKHFLAFTKRKYSVRWNFEIEDLRIIRPDSKETKATIESAKPLTAKEMIKLYTFLNDHINEIEWLKSYTVFRLMYNYGLNKFDIAKISKKTLNVNTGELNFRVSKSNIKLDDEITYIFKTHGADFLPNNDYSVYSKLTDLEKILKRNITQKVIEKTRDRFKMICPQCGELIENAPNRFGFVQVNILNLGGFILCKTCLEKGL